MKEAIRIVAQKKIDFLANLEDSGKLSDDEREKYHRKRIKLELLLINL